MKACPYRDDFYGKLGSPKDVMLQDLEAWLSALEKIVKVRDQCLSRLVDSILIGYLTANPRLLRLWKLWQRSLIVRFAYCLVGCFAIFFALVHSLCAAKSRHARSQPRVVLNDILEC